MVLLQTVEVFLPYEEYIRHTTNSDSQSSPVFRTKYLPQSLRLRVEMQQSM